MEGKFSIELYHDDDDDLHTLYGLSKYEVIPNYPYFNEDVDMVKPTVKVGQQAQGISTTTKISKGQTMPATSPGCEGIGRGATFGRESARGGLLAANKGGSNARGGLNPLG
ncbi:hypothetical protein Acr_00g0076430 [Actinidia rufa]|uniref:Uncharacterized protein n=1 Tax=Actinidia rufa TaxID=165716 RepID=A0A7J0DVD3_9ERIC|nr:hypothetical protein Acr_00g0076430 [Actinidia rufa]